MSPAMHVGLDDFSRDDSARDDDDNDDDVTTTTMMKMVMMMMMMFMKITMTIMTLMIRNRVYMRLDISPSHRKMRGC